MAGISGLGTRALAGQQGPDAAAWAANYDNLGLKVTPANVLAIYGVIAEEVARLRGSIAYFNANHNNGVMPELGEDLVSPFAARGFTNTTRQLLAMCHTEVDKLNRVAQRLKDAAQAYGKSEAEIKFAFDDSKYVYKPTPIPRPEPQAPPSPSGPAPARS